MSSYDRISGGYHLDTLSGDIHITSIGGTGSVFINGNLFVIGTLANVQSVNTFVYDNFITLSANTVGTPILDAGIEVDRGDLPTVGLRWHEPVDRWQVTNEGTYWANLMIRVEDDSDPHLGGNLSTTGQLYSSKNFDIRSGIGHNIVFNPGFDGNSATTALELLFTSNTSVVAYTANSSIVYSQPMGMGQTGLYVTDQQQQSQELINKRRSIIYSLVL